MHRQHTVCLSFFMLLSGTEKIDTHSRHYGLGWALNEGLCVWYVNSWSIGWQQDDLTKTPTQAKKRAKANKEAKYAPIYACSIFHSVYIFCLFRRLLSSTVPVPPLQEESLTYQSKLDTLEADILKCREDLCNINVIAQEAQISKEQARVSCTSSVTNKTPRIYSALLLSLVIRVMWVTTRIIKQLQWI